MDITIQPKTLEGAVTAIPSKSQAHRLLICAALADGDTQLICPDTNRDIEATVDCLNALGASIQRTENGYHIVPIAKIPDHAVLNCRESGSTLRFLLPVVGALGANATFKLAGRLPQRPLSPLWEEMECMGCTLSRPTADTISCTGQLKSGRYTISGNVSSQFITGLLFAISLLPEGGCIEISGQLESKPYVDMTRQAMSMFGITADRLAFSCKQHYHTPGELTVEGDWSNAAFFLAANALGNKVQVTGLNPASAQGDRRVTEILLDLPYKTVISARDIPDLVPILAVTAGAMQGAVFTDIARLRLKESDRVATVIALINAIGGQAEADENTLTVHRTGYRGGIVDAAGDHRIAMAAGIAATVCTDPVTILSAECVNKSYPNFWAEYRRLGGNYELNLR